MTKPKYLKILIHLNKLGAHRKHNIADYLLKEFDNQEDAINAVTSLKEEGYVSGDIYKGAHPILAEDGKLSTEIEIIGKGIDRINKTNSLKISKWALGISIISILFSSVTFIKEAYKELSTDKYTQKKALPLPLLKPHPSSKKTLPLADTIHKANHIVKQANH